MQKQLNITEILEGPVWAYRESIKEVYFKSFIDWEKIDTKKLTEFYSIALQKDLIKITIRTDEETPICFSNRENVCDSLKELKNIIEIYDQSEYETEVTIIKEKVDNTISIYDLQVFIHWLSEKNLYTQLVLFSKLINQDNAVIKFSCIGLNEIYSTSSILFLPSTLQSNCINEINRSKLIEDIRRQSYCIQSGELTVVPQDFSLKTYGKSSDEALIIILNRMKIALSLCAISDFSSFTENNLFIRINGYKTIEETISFDKMNYMFNQTIYEIYEWVYSKGGNISDKLQLAKNIISLHCKYSSIINLDGRTMSSISANYELYLRKNVEQYLQTKKDYTLFITEIMGKIEELSDELLGNMKKNIGAGLTFVVGLIFTNSFSSNKFVDIFTEDITYITSVVLLASFIYAIFSIIDSVSKYFRAVEKVTAIEKSYEDILDKEEIQEIVSNKINLRGTKKRFRKWTIAIGFVWIMLIIIAFSLLDYLSTYKVLYFFDIWNK